MNSQSMRDAVLRAMPASPAEVTAKQIHERVGQWAFRTVKGALLDLIKSGQVVRSGDFYSPTFRKAA